MHALILSALDGILLADVFPDRCDENQMHAATLFKAFDADGSGTIDFDEFRRQYDGLSERYERLKREEEAAEAAEDAKAAAAEAKAAADAAAAAAKAAAEVAAARDRAEAERAAAEAAEAKASARRAAEAAMAKAMQEAAEAAARQAAEEAAVAAQPVACPCGLKFLPELLAPHQRTCAAMHPRKQPMPTPSDPPADGELSSDTAGPPPPPRTSVEFANNGANTFVACSFCARSFFPDRLPVHLRVCKAKAKHDDARGGCRPTMTAAGMIAAGATIGAYNQAPAARRSRLQLGAAIAGGGLRS